MKEKQGWKGKMDTESEGGKV